MPKYSSTNHPISPSRYTWMDPRTGYEAADKFLPLPEGCSPHVVKANRDGDVFLYFADKSVHVNYNWRHSDQIKALEDTARQVHRRVKAHAGDLIENDRDYHDTVIDLTTTIVESIRAIYEPVIASSKVANLAWDAMVNLRYEAHGQR